MRALITVLFLLAFCGGAYASSFTFVDPFNAPASGDVIGNNLQFDIQSLLFSIGADTLSGTIVTNYDNNTLSPFWMGSIPMNIGDVFLTLNSTWMFGIPLAAHEGPDGGLLDSGHLYRITQLAGGLLSARDVLNDPAGVSYRPDEFVWIDNSLSEVDLGAGTVAPEPASMVLIGSALLGLGLSRKIRFWRACAKLRFRRSR